MTMTPISPIRGANPDLGEIPATPAKRPPGRPKGSKNSQNAVRDAERAHQRQNRERKLQRYAQQEARRAPQFQIDQKGTLWILVTLGAVMFLATAVLTADGAISSSAAARFATPTLAFVLFGAVEVAVLVLLAYYMKGSREREDGKPEIATQWFVAMIFASTVAVGLNVYHVLDVYEYDWTSVDMYVGIGIRLVVALFFVLVSKALASVLFAKAVRL